MRPLYVIFYLVLLIAYFLFQYIFFNTMPPHIAAEKEKMFFLLFFAQNVVVSYFLVFVEPSLIERKFHELIRLKEREPPSEKTKGIVALIFLSTAFSSLAFYGSAWLVWNLLGFGLPPAILKKSWKEFSKKEIIVYLAIGITLGVTLKIK